MAAKRMLSSTMTKRSESTPRRVPIENVSEGESCKRERSGTRTGRGAAGRPEEGRQHGGRVVLKVLKV